MMELPRLEACFCILIMMLMIIPSMVLIVQLPSTNWTILATQLESTQGTLTQVTYSFLVA